jgi:hypothetical protein
MFEAGFSKVDITPSDKLSLSGLKDWRLGEDILDRLLASCFYIRSGGSSAAIFSVDLLYVSTDLTELLR